MSKIGGTKSLYGKIDKGRCEIWISFNGASE